MQSQFMIMANDSPCAICLVLYPSVVHREGHLPVEQKSRVQFPVGGL
jgi:hypothetical protein